jgi:hypothetical protein
MTSQLIAAFEEMRDRAARLEAAAPAGAMKRKLFFRGYRLSRVLVYLRERAAR